MTFSMAALKRFGRIVGGATPSSEAAHWGGDVVWYTPGDISASAHMPLGRSARTLTAIGLAACGARIVPVGSVVVTSRAPVGNAAITTRAAAMNQGCKAVVPADDVDGRFVLHAMRAFADSIRSAGTGTTFLEVSGDRLGAIRIPHPRLSEQQLIADFLDREGVRIDAALMRTGVLAETARDAYLSLARAAIVGGGFESVQIRRVARPGTGHTPSRSQSAYWEPRECIVPWFSLADVEQVRDDARDDVVATSERVSYRGIASSSAVLHPAGTVFLSRTASIGFVGRMGVDMAVTQDFMTWTCGPRLHSGFLLHALRALRPEILSLVQGSTHKTIYMPDLMRIAIPLPDLETQIRIEKHLDAAIGARRRVKPSAESMRRTLLQYRDSLIHEAVTGKLDVTNVSDVQMDERLHAATEGRLDEVTV